MAGKKDDGARWRQTSVVIRADIFEQATGQKIDISETCNRALAERLGIDYRQQKIPEGAFMEPVIIASNIVPAPHAMPASPGAKPGVVSATAIINADDPQAAKTVKSRHLEEKPARTVPAPAVIPAPAREKGIAPQPTSPPKEKTQKTSTTRKKKDDSVKKFFASMILRDDTDTALIAKDDLYYAFERWCRDHRVLVIPDKKSFSVTMKNQFAVREKMVDGSPSWVGVQLKK